MNTNSTTYQPSMETQRIQHLDVLRGFALLGILLMNMQTFAMPISAYLNPNSWGDFSGVNFAFWSFSHLFADSKFMSIFSMLFGAGICLFSERAEQKTGRSAALHYQRNFWLMMFGLFHAYFIWFGDILFTYGFCACIFYLFRNFKTTTLTVIALILLSISSAYTALAQWALAIGEIPQEAIDSMKRMWQPEEASLQKEITAYTSGVVAQFEQRKSAALFLQTDVLFSFAIWRVGGLMLLGMAFYKSGILSGKKSTAFYRNMMLLGFAVGLPLTGWGISYNVEHSFALEHSMMAGSQFNYWGSIFTAMAYIGLVHWLIKKAVMVSLQQRLAAVGQMAFTNYIFHSVLLTFVFYGHGLGLFAEVERAGQFLLILLTWGLQLYLSPWWLSRYQFGPLEWLWRSLTYQKLQPLAKR